MITARPSVHTGIKKMRHADTKHNKRGEDMNKAETAKQYLVNVGKRGDDGTEFKVEDANMYISMTPETYQELNTYTQHYEEEVSGCGMVDLIKHESGAIEYMITEVYLPGKQDNSGTTTEIDAEMIHTVMHDLLKSGKDTTRLKMHWHSHADMGVFHSGTDEDNYADLLQSDYLISLVLNRSREILGRIDLAVPFKITASGVPVYIKVPLEQSDDSKQRVSSNLKALDEYIKEEEVKKPAYGTQYWNSEKREWVKQGDGTTALDLKEAIDKEYTEEEQTEYENCPYSYGDKNKHTCDDRRRCVAYNKALDKMWIAESDEAVGYGGGCYGHNR